MFRKSMLCALLRIALKIAFYPLEMPDWSNCHPLEKPEWDNSKKNSHVCTCMAKKKIYIPLYNSIAGTQNKSMLVKNCVVLKQKKYSL